MHHDAPPPDEMITFLSLSARASREQNPLRSLLDAIAKEFDLVHADLERVYDDWFIATAGAGEDMQRDVVDEDLRSDEA